MQKKPFIGLVIATILGVVAGGQLVNRTSAQDTPKKAEPAEKKSESDLLDVLKKLLDPEAPPLPPVTDGKPRVPQPSAPSSFPPLPTAPVPEKAAAQEVVPPPILGPLNNPKEAEKPTTAVAEPPDLDVPRPKKWQEPPPTVQITPYKPPIAAQVAKIKDCLWSLHVEMLDGQTIVTATVNQKHEFKIVCKSLDLQTGKGTLKATGKVQITGDMMVGSCELLAISLHEDRLLLEGGAEVSIQKVPTNVSSEKPARFELKGETLNLRISELESTKLVQANWKAVDVIPMSRGTPTAKDTEGKQWTPYGILRPAKIDLGAKEMAWSLQGPDGKVIAHLVARAGGTLTQYEGRTISVLGVTEQIVGRSMLRVSHIALP